MENGENKDLQGRREFFKEAAKKTLPIIGILALSGMSVKLYAKQTPVTDCQEGCSMGCKFECMGCKGGCTGYCTGCMSYCKDTCYTFCSTDCTGGCKGTCTGGCKDTCDFSLAVGL